MRSLQELDCFYKSHCVKSRPRDAQRISSDASDVLTRDPARRRRALAARRPARRTPGAHARRMARHRDRRQAAHLLPVADPDPATPPRLQRLTYAFWLLGVLGAWRSALAALLLVGWIGLTVAGSLLHLLSILGGIRHVMRTFPPPHPVRDEPWPRSRCSPLLLPSGCPARPVAPSQVGQRSPSTRGAGLGMPNRIPLTAAVTRAIDGPRVVVRA